MNRYIKTPALVLTRAAGSVRRSEDVRLLLAGDDRFGAVEGNPHEPGLWLVELRTDLRLRYEEHGYLDVQLSSGRVIFAPNPRERYREMAHS